MARSVLEYKQDVAQRRAEILREFQKYYPGVETTRIEKAFDYAELLHRGQLRKSGIPYIFHPLAVSKLVAQSQLDEVSLIAALLHDSIEDTYASKKSISEAFSPTVADFVEALTKIKTAAYEKTSNDKELTYQKILRAASKDVRPLIIKIYDRLDNMRGMEPMSPEHRKRVSRETIDIYVPITRRLGLSRIERELVNLSLRHLYPDEYAQLVRRIDEEAKQRSEEFISVVESVSQRCHQRNIRAEVVPMWTSPADFYQPETDFRHQADIVWNYTIFVDDLIDIYTVLGILHTTYKPTPQAVRDLIAHPLANGYRALETRLVINDRLSEFALVTPEMFEVNSHGIIHNWKTNQNRLAGFYTSYMRALEDLTADEEIHLDEVLHQTKVEGVAVFSPKKDLFILPRDATVLDFAYEVHKEIGEHAKGALVNGVERPIHQRLNSGDVVQVLTDPAVHPDESWVHMAISPKVRSMVKNWIKRQVDRRAIELGREMLYFEIAKYGRDPKVIIEGEEFSRILAEARLDKDTLLRRIGYRQVLASDFIEQHRLVPKEMIERQQRLEKATIRDKLFSTLKIQRGPRCRFTKDDIFIKYAGCCNPIFGDQVVGVVQAERGIVVHRRECLNLKKVATAERIEVEWDSPEEIKSARLNLHVNDERGVFAKILNIVSRYGGNIAEFNAYTVGHEAFLKLRLDISNQRELLRIVNEIRKIDAVDTITREE